MEQASSSERIGATRDEFSVSKVIRLSIQSCPGPVGSLLNGFRNVCYEAHNLEELFLIVIGDKWVRAVIGHEDLDLETWTTIVAGRVPSQCIIDSESDIGLYLPYWSDCQGRAITRLHIPSQMRQEVFVEEISLVDDLWRRMNAGKDWKIKPLSMLFLEKHDADADVKPDREIARGVSTVLWRGHIFVLKDIDDYEYDDDKEFDNGFGNEFDYVKRLSPHLNIVSGFGVLCERSGNKVQKAYFMEYISGGDLFDLIVDGARSHGNLPPFPSHDALDILWQFANAVKHMHQQGVVHCDLKSNNVLVSVVSSSSKATPCYRVKVADFGNARKCEEPQYFRAGGGTTCYEAPESLQQRGNNPYVIKHPDKIDVYSFGVVAYELLTGEVCDSGRYKYGKDEKEATRSEFLAGVIKGDLRPPLREKCKAHIKRSREWRFSNFGCCERQSFERYWPLQQEDLMHLIERCWGKVPTERPSIREIWRDLGRFKLRFLREWESR